MDFPGNVACWQCGVPIRAEVVGVLLVDSRTRAARPTTGELCVCCAGAFIDAIAGAHVTLVQNIIGDSLDAVDQRIQGRPLGDGRES
jgi:hypothetical protein